MNIVLHILALKCLKIGYWKLSFAAFLILKKGREFFSRPSIDIFYLAPIFKTKNKSSFKRACV